jgi:hypothetical protein
LENDNTQFPENYGWIVKITLILLWPFVAILNIFLTVATWLLAWGMLPSSLITLDTDLDADGELMLMGLKIVFPWQFIPSISFTRSDTGRGLSIKFDSVLP